MRVTIFDPLSSYTQIILHIRKSRMASRKIIKQNDNPGGFKWAAQ